MSIDEARVRDAWDRNATLWAERVRSGVDHQREERFDTAVLKIAVNDTTRAQNGATSCPKIT